MSRRAALAALALLLPGCGGSDAAPEKKSPATGGSSAQACDDAKRLIADLPTPEDLEGLADYADQAATALEKAKSGGVEPLRDAELAAAEQRVVRLQATLRALEASGGKCGEDKAYDVMAPAVYAYGLAQLLQADARYLRRHRPPPGDIVAASRVDAERQKRIAAALRKLAVPEPIRKEHDRYVAGAEEYSKHAARKARNPSVPGPEENGVGARRDRAYKALKRELGKLPGGD